MGNKRNRRSRRHETPSPDRELSEAQVETPMQGNESVKLMLVLFFRNL